MNSSDLNAAIFAGNDIAMQWWTLTHPQNFPQPGTVTLQPTPSGGTSLQVGSGALLLLALAAVVVIVILND